MEDDVDDEVEETGLLGVTGVEGGVGVFGRKNEEILVCFWVLEDCMPMMTFLTSRTVS